MSKIPTLAGQYGAPTPGAGDLLAGGHALPPLGALTLVRTAIASLCAAAALMVASALVLTAVALTVGDEPRASGVGATSHMPRLPCLIEYVRGPGRVSRSATPACGYPYTWAGSAADAWAGAVGTRDGTTIQEHPAGCAVLGGYLRPLIRDAQYYTW